MANGTNSDNFDIDPDVADILEEMRQNKLQWIADEVEHRIREGAVESSEFVASGAKTSKRFEAVRGFTSEEQVDVLLRAVRNYLLLPSEIWDEAQKNLATKLTAGKPDSLTVEIAPPGIDSLPLTNIFDSTSQPIVDEAIDSLQPFLKNLKK